MRSLGGTCRLHTCMTWLTVVVHVVCTHVHAMRAGYRHLAVSGAGATERNFYHLNTEHAIADANLEIGNTSTVNVYGLKSEGRNCVRYVHALCCAHVCVTIRGV